MRTAAISSILAAAVALSPAPGAADEPLHFFADGGIAKPTGPSAFADVWKVGAGMGVGAEYAMTPIVAMWGRVGYARYALDEASANGRFYTQGPPTGVSGGELSIWTMQLGARLRPQSGVVRPYVDLGVGYESLARKDILVRYQYFITGEELSYVVKSATETKPGVVVGAGLLYAPRPWLGLFVDAHVDVVLTSSEWTHYVPIRVGALIH